MDRLDSALRSFYKYFHRYPSKWKDLTKAYEKCTGSLCNQMEQLQLIQSVLDAKLKLLEIPLLKENLLGKIHAAIEKEVQLLNKLVKECGSLNQELQEKYELVRRASTEVATVSLKGTPTVPAAALLTEWAEDVSRYYQGLYLQVSSPLHLLNYEDRKFTLLLKEAAREEEDLMKHIEKILAYTQFMDMDD